MKSKFNLSVNELIVNESFLNYYFRKNEADVWEWEEHLEIYPEAAKNVAAAFQLLDTLSLKWTENQIREKYHQLLLVEKPSFFNLHFKKIASLAASILIISFFAFQYFKSPVSPIYQDLTEGKALIEKVNISSKPLLVLLSDGSSILLSQNARLSYPGTFTGDKREVFLDGEAFFEVAKKPEMPFYVYANEIVTKVIGTSFKITALKGQKNINVIVRTGKVTVYRLKQITTSPIKTETKGLVITENQQIVFEKEPETFAKSLVSQPQIIPTEKNIKFEYDETPATSIFNDLQSAYGVQFIYDEALFKDCTVTASLTDEPLKEKLNLICQAIEANYEITDGQIIIQGVGCK